VLFRGAARHLLLWWARLLCVWAVRAFEGIE
jgi:hypothetical protein